MSKQTRNRRHSLADIIARWERLLAGAELNKDDMPALEKWRSRLQSALGDTKAAYEQRETLCAETRKATQDFHALLRLGRELAAQFESGVRLLYGRRSAKLGEFGIKALIPRAKQARGGCGAKGCPLDATPTAK